MTLLADMQPVENVFFRRCVDRSHARDARRGRERQHLRGALEAASDRCAPCAPAVSSGRLQRAPFQALAQLNWAQRTTRSASRCRRPRTASCWKLASRADRASCSRSPTRSSCRTRSRCCAALCPSPVPTQTTRSTTLSARGACTFRLLRPAHTQLLTYKVCAGRTTFRARSPAFFNGK